MSLKDDLEEGEIADESRNNDSDSRFGLNSNAINISINGLQTNQTFDRHLTQTNVSNISPIFQSVLCRTSDSLFGSSDTDLRFADNQFNDCDLRSINANEQTLRQAFNRNNSHNSHHNNNDFYHSFVDQNVRKPNLLVNTSSECHSSLRRQSNDCNKSSNLMTNNNNLRSIGLQESQRFSAPPHISDKQIGIQMRPQLRPNKALLPTPIITISQPIQTPFQQICPPIRSRFDANSNGQQMNYQSLNSSHLLSHSNQLLAPFPQQEWTPRTRGDSNLFTYSTYLNPVMPKLSPPLLSNENMSQIQTQIKSFDSISPQIKSTDLFESQNINLLDKTANDSNNTTIVLSSDEIEVVQMFDETMSNGSQSPYDPEQEIIYIPPLSPPLDMSKITTTESNSNHKSKDENPISSKTRSQLKPNETSFVSTALHKSPKFNSNSIQRERNRIRSGSEERKERLNRLLKSNTVEDKISNRNCVKRHPKKSKLKDRDLVTSKSPKTSPRESSKASHSRSPIRKCSHKVSVHRESCKRAKNSRRNFKRIRKRKVLTQIPQTSNRPKDFRPKSRNEIQDASYEDLLEEYKRIQSQLKDLEKEEKNDEVVVIYDSDKELDEVIDQNVKSVEINEINDDSKDDQIMSEDDDELELRRLALESKKIRVQTPVNIDSESFEYEELDENVLREQLLKSLLKAKAKTDSTIKDSSVKETESQLNFIKQNSELTNENSTETEKEISLNEGIEPNVKIDQIPVVTILKPKLIINFGDDSSDDEQEAQKPQRKVVTTAIESIPVGLDSFIRQARLQSKQELSKSQIILPKKKAPAVVGKLSITQQMEYQKLKAEIARREKYQVSDVVLKRNELKWKTSKANLQEKISKVNALKTKVALKRNALRKAQQHARKMQESFIAATRVVSATAAEFHSLNEDLKTNENAVTVETNNVNQFEKQCIRMGLKIHGNTYKLPIASTVKRVNRDSMSSTLPVKKRTKSETIQLSKQEIADEKKRLQELERIYSKRLQDLKNASLLRPTSPKMVSSVSPKSPQTTSNAVTPEISNANNDKILPLSKVQVCQKALQALVKEFLKIPRNHSLISLDCFIELMFSDKDIKTLESIISVPDVEHKVLLSADSDSHTELYDSVLSHLHSYRLIDNQPKDISSDHWTNNLNPLENICRYDLLGTCNDEKCLWQHINQCLLDSSNKIVDLLLYDPKLAGITSQIHDGIDIKVLHNIRNNLQSFAQKQIEMKPQLSIEAHCRQIANQIRNNSKESTVCLLTRRIPKLFSTSKIEVPFDDLCYRFNIRDKSLVLNEAKISELRLSSDPDIYFHNRFYAPEGVPISAELETSLASDPNNIQLWIKLAYYHITKCSNHNFADSIDRALNVLSRALEQNKTDPELYEHYLFIYSNRILRNGEDSRFSLINICRKIVEHCPHYRVWKLFLSLCTSFEDKASVATQLLNNLTNNIIINNNFEIRSHQILEVLMYKIRLYLQQNDYCLAVSQLSEALNKSSEQFLSEIQSLKPVLTSKNNFCYISDQITDSDRVFAWLCFIHLLVYHNLPEHCFELFKQEFPQLIHKTLFVFDWSALIQMINITDIRKCLNTALELCHFSKGNDINIDKNSLAIYINLAELNRYDTNEPNIYEDLMQMSRNDSSLWPLIVEHRFKFDENHKHLIQILKGSQMYSDLEIKVYLSVATHYYQLGELVNARNEMLVIAAFYYRCHISYPTLRIAFETLLFEDEENNHNFELLNARKSKESRSPLLWLCYILLLKIESVSEHQIDSAFQSALALCSIDKSCSVDLQLLWWNYLEFMMKNVKNQNQFLYLFESVRHCCLTVSDPTFQIQIVNYFCKILSNNDKLNALMQFSKLMPENITITMSAISLALRMNRKETCWLLINSIIFDKKVRLQCLQFWKIAIALAIERSDHLSVHKFFQMAISLLPYNKVLWETFKTYETSIKHVEHLKQAQDVCHNQLKIGLNNYLFN